MLKNKLYLVRFDRYIMILLFLYFCILSLIFGNVLQALHVNPGCLKCISGINYLLLIKIGLLFHWFYILYWLVNSSKRKEDLLKEFYLKVFLFLKLLNNPLASSFFNKLWYFTQSHNEHFDRSILPLFPVLATFGVLLSAFFLHFKQLDHIIL